MQALILAAGEGTRLEPLTATRPKAMLELAGKPLIEHTIGALKNYVNDITIIVGWKGAQIREHFEGREDIHFKEQKERSGTANAIGVAEFDEPFICVNGDVLVTEKTIKRLRDAYAAKNATTMVGAKKETYGNLGLILLKGDRVIDIKEKCKGKGLVNAGIYLFTPEIFEAIGGTERSVRGEYEITDSLLRLPEVHCLTSNEPWLELSNPWDLLNFNEFYLNQAESDIKGIVEDNVVIKGTVIVEENATVRAGSYIEGPVFIGKDCDIGPNCYIRKYTSIGNNCRVGQGVELKNSIIMKNTNIPHHNYVGDSIIGENCNIGSGTKVANLRLDDKPIYSYIKGRKINTERRKLGVIMGDGVKTGINSTIDCGTVISEDSFIGPGAHANGFVRPRSKIYA